MRSVEYTHLTCKPCAYKANFVYLKYPWEFNVCERDKNANSKHEKMQFFCFHCVLNNGWATINTGANREAHHRQAKHLPNDFQIVDLQIKIR